METKLPRVNEIVVANNAAKGRYGVTVPGWVGIVRQVDYIRGEMIVEEYNGHSYKVAVEDKHGNVTGKDDFDLSILPGIIEGDCYMVEFDAFTVLGPLTYALMLRDKSKVKSIW